MCSLHGLSYFILAWLVAYAVHRQPPSTPSGQFPSSSSFSFLHGFFLFYIAPKTLPTFPKMTFFFPKNFSFFSEETLQTLCFRRLPKTEPFSQKYLSFPKNKKRPQKERFFLLFSRSISSYLLFLFWCRAIVIFAPLRLEACARR